MITISSLSRHLLVFSLIWGAVAAQMLGQWGNQHQYRVMPRQNANENGNGNGDNNNQNNNNNNQNNNQNNNNNDQNNNNQNNNNGPDTSAFNIMNGRIFTPGLGIILAVSSEPTL